MRKVLKLLVSFILIVGGFFLYYSYFSGGNPPITFLQKPAVKIIKPDHLNTNLMFFGDVFWGRYINDWSMANSLKEAYPFSGLYTLNRENYQAWIGDLDCPITDKQVSSAEMDATLTFNCTPNYLKEAKKWFNAFNLANSHTENQGGLTGFNQTRKYLDANGIQYFGHYDKTVTDEICEIITVKANASINGTDYSLQKKTNYKLNSFNMPIAICGYHDTFALPTQDQLDEIHKYTDKFVTLIYAIQGSEYGTTADGLQNQYFRAMIDEGADAVIGKGAHVVQNTEVYKGKLIVYSMGNFIFDQQASPDVTKGIGVTVNLDFKYNSDVEKWQSIVAKCTKFKDDCLAQSIKLKLNKPEFNVKYDITAIDNSGKLAKKGSNALQTQMIQRANWDTTIKSLGQ